jgi:hypothetical protein
MKVYEFCRSSDPILYAHDYNSTVSNRLHKKGLNGTSLDDITTTECGCIKQ